MERWKAGPCNYAKQYMQLISVLIILPRSRLTNCCMLWWCVMVAVYLPLLGHQSVAIASQWHATIQQCPSKQRSCSGMIVSSSTFGQWHIRSPLLNTTSVTLGGYRISHSSAPSLPLPGAGQAVGGMSACCMLWW